MQWQVKVSNNWKDLDPAVVRQFVANQGKKTFLYEWNGQTYTVHEDTSGQWVQKNNKTGKVRPLRRWAPPDQSAKTSARETNPASIDYAPAGSTIFVWRDGDWHPVSRNETRQIFESLHSGKKRFEVSCGSSSYIVNTEGRSGWVREGASGVTRPMMCVEAGRKDDIQGRRLSASAVQEELLQELNMEWAHLIGRQQASVSSKDVTVSEKDIEAAVMKRTGPLNGDDRELLERSVADLFLNVDLHQSGRICVVEWLHYRLMQEQAPSYFAAVQVNDFLRGKIRKESDYLRRAQEVFIKSCKGSHDLRLTPGQMRTAMKVWKQMGHSSGVALKTADAYESEAKENHALYQASASQKDGNVQGHAAGNDGSLSARFCNGHLVSAFSECMRRKDGLFTPRGGPMPSPRTSPPTTARSARASTVVSNENEEEELSYYDFITSILGKKQEAVHLLRYDITQGKVGWLAPVLVGQSVEGIWHTSILVHDREYWFGGKIFESQPYTTPFGKPTKTEVIGGTMRTRDDLWNFIQRELVDDFTSQNYDVLHHNCNHFSNSVCKFLTNQDIPADVLAQPSMVLDSWSGWMMRPWLNQALGGFNGTTAGVNRTCRTPASPASHEHYEVSEWDRIQQGMFVSYEHLNGWPFNAQVMKKTKDSCDVRWLDLAEGKLQKRSKVPPQEVHLPRPGLGASLVSRGYSRDPVEAGPPVHEEVQNGVGGAARNPSGLATEAAEDKEEQASTSPRETPRLPPERLPSTTTPEVAQAVLARSAEAAAAAPVAEPPPGAASSASTRRSVLEVPENMHPDMWSALPVELREAALGPRPPEESESLPSVHI
eukprot:TRINITY_DN1487_c1_g1_i1.p1 TRINITY_DN1487_c1_g1~~TRINITY_DN1487_c1_g1_i1.p1  ORF type:complete len:828 (+),score=150.53 TRINITY_DN1487_c1_g1_i1:80-2563(+)